MPVASDGDFSELRNESTSEACEFTILMPCLDEAETLTSCISKARAFLARSGCTGEVVIADNGSTDGSQAIAAANGARVVHVAERGYGSALLAAIRAAHGKYVIMGDSDDSYDFGRLDPFVGQLRAGYQLVMGNRYRGGILPRAMPPMHRYLGNPMLTAIGLCSFAAAAEISIVVCAASTGRPFSRSIFRRGAWSSRSKCWSRRKFSTSG